MKPEYGQPPADNSLPLDEKRNQRLYEIRTLLQKSRIEGLIDAQTLRELTGHITGQFQKSAAPKAAASSLILGDVTKSVADVLEKAKSRHLIDGYESSGSRKEVTFRIMGIHSESRTFSRKNHIFTRREKGDVKLVLTKNPTEILCEFGGCSPVSMEINHILVASKLVKKEDAKYYAFRHLGNETDIRNMLGNLETLLTEMKRQFAPAIHPKPGI